MAYLFHQLERPFVMTRGLFKTGLGASAGGLRVELVGVGERGARLRLWVESEDGAKIDAQIEAGSGRTVFEDYRLTVHRVARGSLRSAEVELSVAELPRPDEAFAAVHTPSEMSNRCTPKDQHPFACGIRINAPRRVALGKERYWGRSGAAFGYARVVIAGTWSFTGRELNRLGLSRLRHTEHGFTVHARKQGEPPQQPWPMDTINRIPNEVLPEHVLPDYEPPKDLPGDLEMSGYFNIDVGGMVAPEPDSRGDYSVWVEAGEHRSNEASIEIARK